MVGARGHGRYSIAGEGSAPRDGAKHDNQKFCDVVLSLFRSSLPSKHSFHCRGEAIPHKISAADIGIDDT